MMWSHQEAADPNIAADIPNVIEAAVAAATTSPAPVTADTPATPTPPQQTRMAPALQPAPPARPLRQQHRRQGALNACTGPSHLLATSSRRAAAPPGATLPNRCPASGACSTPGPACCGSTSETPASQQHIDVLLWESDITELSGVLPLVLVRSVLLCVSLPFDSRDVCEQHAATFCERGRISSVPREGNGPACNGGWGVAHSDRSAPGPSHLGTSAKSTGAATLLAAVGHHHTMAGCLSPHQLLAAALTPARAAVQRLPAILPPASWGLSKVMEYFWDRFSSPRAGQQLNELSACVL